MQTVTRRNFMKLAAASGAALASGGALVPPALAGSVNLKKGGQDFSPRTGKERQMIPSACWSCVTRDAMVGFVEDGRLVKLEGHPDSIRTRGKLCAKGQAGINQVYFPDRVLYPMRRVGKRGEGKWKRITWDEALEEIAGRLKPLRDGGHPEKFMFHYGRMKGSSSKLIKSVFLATYGTKTIGNHTSICEGAKWVGQELTWGKHYDNWDFEQTKFILNFGSGVLEAHTMHIPLAQRLINAQVGNGARFVTFDVRLSNTAAKSDEWIPIKPGTDRDVVLAMCKVIMDEGLYDREFLEFCKVTPDRNASVDQKVAYLKKHLAEYTPEWAEKHSGVPADTTRRLALELARTKPACVISYRGAIAHYHGADTERAIQMLASITGNIDNPGGRCQTVAPKWKYPKGPKEKPKAKELHIVNGFPGDVAFPNHHVNHQVLKMIKDGQHGRPDVYMWYCYQPVYSNGDQAENAEILKDESLIPFTVCSTITYDESSKLADIILPDATYLERWDWEDAPMPDQKTEFYIRQPLVKPLGEARDLSDFMCDLAERLGMPLGFKNKEEFVKMSCDMTPGVKEAGGFEYMKKHGVWHDPGQKPKYYAYRKPVKDADLNKDGVLYDEATGVYWNWHKSKAKSAAEAGEKGYTHTKNAYKGYVGQRIGDKVYKGFKPDKVNKSGYMELYSELMAMKKLPALPSHTQIPGHDGLAGNELILTTYKVPVHIHSRSSHCKWLTEIYHDNPAQINPATATRLGIKDGDTLKVSSELGEIAIRARVTNGIHPDALGISFHVGREESGRYASGRKSPLANDNDPDLKLMEWKAFGVSPNWIIPSRPDPISGEQRWMDTVVKVTKA